MRSAALRSILFVMVAAAAGGFVAPSAQATTRDVCPAACTYSTIQSATDAALDGDLIDIGPGTYVERVLVATPNLTFAGAGAGTTVVEGVLETFFFDTAAQTATLTGVTLHSIGASTCLYNRATLTVRDTVIEGCITMSAGGGIYTSGDLVLERVTVRNNTATPANFGQGGGIYVDGDPALGGPVVRILDSEVTGNLALIGGGIYIGTGARVFVDSTLISTNSAGDTTGTFPYTGVGGGIRTYGELHLTNSTLRANAADLRGGGVAVRCGDVPVRIANTLFTGNATPAESYDVGAGSWGGGLYVESDGEVTVTGSAFEANIAGHGAGIGVYNLLTTGSVAVTHSSITGNVAYGDGGGLWVFGGTVSVNAVTIESNMANGHGGGIDLSNIGNSALTLKNATVYGNLALVQGGGLAHSPGAEMVNTILAGNSTFAAPSDCSGSISSLDFNLIGTAGGCAVVGALNDLLGTDALPLDPLLGPGSYNDGITRSRPPLPGSPAVDSGGQCGSLDQNGRQRRADGGTGVEQCDRGAVELNASCGTPRPTTALDPATGASAVALSPLLVWKPAVGAASYEVKLSTQQSPFADGIVATASGLTATHWVPDITLLPGTTYYWKVIATSQCGQTSKSPVFSFTTL